MSVNDHRRLAVPKGVRHEVRQDSVEHRRVDCRLQILRDLERDLGRPIAGRHPDDLIHAPANREALRVDRNGVRIQAREIEELLDEQLQADRLRAKRVLQLRQLVGRDLVPAAVDGLDDAVDDSDRHPELVRRERVAFQLVGVLERCRAVCS